MDSPPASPYNQSIRFRYRTFSLPSDSHDAEILAFYTVGCWVQNYVVKPQKATADDYVLWAIQRAYERGEYRYYNFLKEKIKVIYDIFNTNGSDGNKKGIVYTPDNPLVVKNRSCVRLGTQTVRMACGPTFILRGS